MAPFLEAEAEAICLQVDETVIMLSVLSRDRNVFTGSNFNIELQQWHRVQLTAAKTSIMHFGSPCIFLEIEGYVSKLPSYTNFTS